MPGGPWPESFLEMMAVERGAARYTLDAYQRDLADYARFFRTAQDTARQRCSRRPSRSKPRSVTIASPPSSSAPCST